MLRAPLTVALAGPGRRLAADRRPRQAYETGALLPFRKVLRKHGLRWYSGQGAENCVNITGRVGFQFGDLRFSLGGCHLVVEAETVGGVTNLAKYWYCLREGLVDGKIFLFHVFWQETPDSYRSHLLVWDLLRAEIRKEFPGRFHAWRYGYAPDTVSRDLAEAAARFERLLRQITSRSTGPRARGARVGR